MKFLISLTLVLISSVTFLYYLLQNTNFLPVNSLGEYDWTNISTLVLLLTLILISFLNISIFLVLKMLKKDWSNRDRMFFSVKFSIILTVGIITILILNFFHILDLMWGGIIFIVVILFLFII